MGFKYSPIIEPQPIKNKVIIKIWILEFYFFVLEKRIIE